MEEIITINKTTDLNFSGDDDADNGLGWYFQDYDTHQVS